MANVIFKTGTRAQYDAIAFKDANTLYWLLDTQELYKGEALFGKGANATADAAGLMSPEDKELLGKLAQGGVFNLVPVDASVVVSDAESGGKQIGVQVSKDTGNILSLHGDGLFAGIDAVPIEKVTGLEARLTDIEQAIVGGVHYKGSVPTVEDLPADAAQGDLYEVTADNSEWCFNGEKWFEYGTSVPAPAPAYEFDKDQFQVAGNAVSIKDIDGEIVTYLDKTLAEWIREFGGMMVWQDMGSTISVDPSTTSDVQSVINGMDNGSIVDFDSGEISSELTIDKSATIKGANAGSSQNHDQEV